MLPLTPLTTEQRAAKRADFVQEINYGDLSAGVSNTALVLTPFTTKAKTQGIELSHIELVTPFQDTSDTANASTALIIGDAGSTNRHLTSTELNANGTYIPLANGTGTKYVPTSDTGVEFTFTPTSGKNVANLKVGRLLAYFRIINSLDAQPIG